MTAVPVAHADHLESVRRFMDEEIPFNRELGMRVVELVRAASVGES